MEDQVLPARSYDIEQLDPSTELPRLALQAKAALDLELAFLRRLKLPEDATIVDLGCGPGHITAHLSRLVPRGQVIGVDIDEGLLAQARAQASAQGLHNVRFVRTWAHDAPLPSGQADLVYARFLLQHHPEPREVVAEMYRLARPGGLVVALDTDDGALVIHPEPAGLQRLLAAAAKAQRRRGGDRQVGRKLRGYLAQEGLHELRVELVPFTSELVGMRTFAEICLGFKRKLVDPADMEPAAVEAVIEAVTHLDARPTAFAHALVYVAQGRRPG